MYYLAGLKAGFKGCKGRKYRGLGSQEILEFWIGKFVSGIGFLSNSKISQSKNPKSLSVANQFIDPYRAH